jgi:Tfp pilus assembly protein FimT
MMSPPSIPAATAASRRGFTLVDVAIAVLIMGLVAATAVPRFGDAVNRHRALSTARRIQSDLERARRHAISASRDVVVRFDPAADTYGIPALSHLNDSQQTWTVALSDYPYVANLASADFGGDAAVVFNLHGVPDSGGVIAVSAGRWREELRLDPLTGRAATP